MVRDHLKVYAELNDENTVLSQDITENINSIMVGDNTGKGITQLTSKDDFGILYFDIDGTVKLLDPVPNKYLGINDLGRLDWIDIGE